MATLTSSNGSSDVSPESITEQITHSAEETFEIAYRLAESLTSSTVFLLEGDLGAGKTVFAKGLAAGLEIDPADVSSPTFTLVNQYEGRLRLFHLDLYRLSGSLDEIRQLGLDEMLEDPAGVVVIEWPDRLGRFAIPHARRVTIEDLGGDNRKVKVESRK